MDNLQRPADPQPITHSEGTGIITSWEYHSDFSGFTKLEKAALMIAQRLSARHTFSLSSIAEESVVIAKAVLEEANK